MPSKICEHKKVGSTCVKCAKAGKGGGGICCKPGHGWSRRFVCVGCAREGTGGAGICKQHDYQRKSRCKGCAADSLKNTSELCKHLVRAVGSKSEGCSLCQKEAAEEELRQYYRKNPPSVGGTPRTPVFDGTSPRAK
jgi:hypothetical protein